MYRSKISCGVTFASCLVFISILVQSPLTLAISDKSLRGEVSNISKISKHAQDSYERILENDGSHSGHSHSGHSHSGDGTEDASAVTNDASDESEYQMNLESAAYNKKPQSTVIILCASMLYAGVAVVLFLLIKRDRNDNDEKNLPLVTKEEVESVNSFSKVSLPSMKTIDEERRLAEKCCAIIGVHRPTGIASNSNSFAVV